MLLVRAALPSRFNELRRPEVAAYLEVRAREETGHDRLALKDLRALCVPGELSTGALVKTSRTRSSDSSQSQVRCGANRNVCSC
jgi:hypothetical protein